MRRRIKSKVYLSLILTCVLTTVIGLTYGVFTITTGKYKVAEMLISNLMYGIDITTTGGSETIENKTVTLSSGNTSTVLVKITSLNPIDSNYSLEYKITSGEGNIYYASTTGWMPSGKISKTNGLVYIKTVKVVIEATSNITVDFNVSGGYTHDKQIASLEGYNKITEVFDKTYNYTEESSLKEIIEKETNCKTVSCIYGGETNNNYLQYPTSSNVNENIWRIIGTNEEGIKLISNKISTSNINGIEESLNSFYETLEKKEDYIVNTNKFNCKETGCDETNYNNIGLISTYEYNLIGGINSYLASSENFYTINENEIDNITPGGIEETNELTTSGIRPSIYLTSDVNVTGSGTSSDPYRLSSKGDIILANATLNGSPLDTFPSETDPYIVKSVNCSNGTEGYYSEEKKTIILTSPNLPTTCTVDFMEGYTVTMIGEGATINAPTNHVVGRIGSTTFTYEVKEGYNQNTATVNCTNGAVGAIDNNKIKITNIKSASTCTLTLEENTYTVTASVTGGSANPTSRTGVAHGGSTTFTISASANYNLSGATVSGTGCTLSSDKKTLTASNVTSNRTCTVTIPLSYQTLANTIKSAYPSKGARSSFNAIYTTTGLHTIADYDGKTSYYFTGNPNNWVSFAGKLWRIIRINGDGSVRLLYAGSGGTDGYLTNVGQTAYNPSYNHPAYVGWKYTVGGSQSADRGNSTVSPIYSKVKSWYDTLSSTDKAYINTNAVYCNDRNITSGSYSTSSTFYYAGYTRFVTNKNAPTLSCHTSDQFKDGFGLMTADEVVMAGGLYGTNNPNVYYYLNKDGGSATGSYWWWTMSPSEWTGDIVGIFFVLGSNDSGLLGSAHVGNTYGVVRPVVSLKSSVLVTGGNGTGASPYTLANP